MLGNEIRPLLKCFQGGDLYQRQGEYTEDKVNIHMVVLHCEHISKQANKANHAAALNFKI